MAHETPVSHRLLGASASAPASLPPHRYAPHLAHAVSATRSQCTPSFSTSCVGSPCFEADSVLGAGPAKRSDAFAGTLPSLCTLQTIRQNLHVSLPQRSASNSLAISRQIRSYSFNSMPRSTGDNVTAVRRKQPAGDVRSVVPTPIACVFLSHNGERRFLI